MDGRTVGRWERLPARLVVVALAASLLSTRSGDSPEALRTLFHDEPVPTEMPPGSVRSTNGLAFQNDPAAGLVELFVDVAVDEDFLAQVGEGWETKAGEIVEGANALLLPVGLHLQVGSVQRWGSDDTVTTIATLLRTSEDQVGRGPGRLFVAITCQDTVRYDGWSQRARGRAIIRFYHRDQARNSALLAHEIGHLMGLGHHEDEDECSDDGCLMDERGYAHATGWCEHHERQFQANLALALAAQGS